VTRGPNPPRTRQAAQWVRSSWNGLRKYGTGRTFLNFAGRADEPM
jgi:hypothetical protein